MPCVLSTALEALRVSGICLQPFVPSVAEQLLHVMWNLDSEERIWIPYSNEQVSAGRFSRTAGVNEIEGVGLEAEEG
jgi:hypothetical protein